MSAKHTPGPWRTGRSFVESAGECSTEVFAPNNVLVGEAFGGSFVEAEANARLMATAPDMAGAIREYLEWGAMTSSDRHRFEAKFRALLARIDGD